MKTQALKTLDAPSVPFKEIPQIFNQGDGQSPLLNYLELNNRVIEDAYFVSKKREHV